jgi:hypothetical protein
MLLHVSIFRSPSGSVHCSLLKLYVKMLITLLYLLVMRQHMLPTLPPVQYVWYLFPAGKSAGAWRQSPTPSSAEVKKRVELYLYSNSGPSWSVTSLLLYCWIADGKTNDSGPNDSRCSLIQICS